MNIIAAQPQCDYCCERCARPLGLCPQCCQPRAEGALICIHCGLDFRTGKKVVASPSPQHFGNFSLFPLLPDEWKLSMRRRFLGDPTGTQEFHIAGFDNITAGKTLHSRKSRHSRPAL